MQGLQCGVQDSQPVIGPGGAQGGDRLCGLVTHADRGVRITGQCMGPGQVGQVQRPGSGAVGAEPLNSVE